MKNTYLFLIAFVFWAGISFAQTPTFQLVTWTATNVPIGNNQIFDLGTAPLITKEAKFKLKNITATTQIFTIRKNDNVINTVTASDLAEASFCAGSACYTPTVFIASVTIAANSEENFIANLLEASAVGLSNISYDITNGSEQLTVVFKYNYTLGIKTNLNDPVKISNIYPNPCASKAFIDVNAIRDINATQLKIYNSLGSIVSSKEISLNKGKNTIELESETFEAGIYFVNVSNGSTHVTKKLTVAK